MLDFMNETIAPLAIFLQKALALLSDSWWKSNVLDVLTPSQLRFVEENNIKQLSELDFAALLRVFDQNWYQISSEKRLPLKVRNLLKELQEIRNKWAHKSFEDFPLDDRLRDIDTLCRFLKGINFEGSLLKKIEEEREKILYDISEDIKPKRTGNLTIEMQINNLEKRKQGKNIATAKPNDSPLFKEGEEVQSRSDSTRVGIIRNIHTCSCGSWVYNVFWNNGRTRKVIEEDLRLHTYNSGPSENLIMGNLGGFRDFQRLITYNRLIRDKPIQNNIYAFNASRTKLYPYQFKPLMKFLDSPNQRILICDEVGLGKTIEAGLIFTEYKARYTIKRVLIVCPSHLKEKWQIEMKNRFDERFDILSGKEFLAFLKDNMNDPQNSEINGIISLESLRTKNILEELELQSPFFDLVIIDEAHHMRNFGKKQRRVGVALSSTASAIIMLTATPVHLGYENLYSLLNILDDDDFPDKESVLFRLQENQPIVKAQSCLANIPPLVDECILHLERVKNSEWIKYSPQYETTRNQVEALKNNDGWKDINKSYGRDYTQLIEAQKSLANLNLLGHVFTRTKKRDVHENISIRRAHSIEVKFTKEEQMFYDAVTEYVKDQVKQNLSISQKGNWQLNMPQRRMASSIPAMVDFYKNEFLPLSTSIEEYEVEPDYVFDSEENDFNNEPREKLINIVKAWPIDYEDSKYDKLVNEILKKLKEQEGRIKTIIFATFKATLEYLKIRLEKDGFGTTIIHGDIPQDIRCNNINLFKTNPNIEILLSSRVGSEGLDLQFANTMVNYDLPWNPMEIEQRIGRLDRIGQISPTIHIFNIWIKGSIEERILKRLYDRVGIFKNSIGDLEPILGEIIREIDKNILSKDLTSQEEELLWERTNKAIQEKQIELKKLERDSARFIGTDKYFDEEVNKIIKRRRYITSLQMKNFVDDFLGAFIPGTKLERGENEHLHYLIPNKDLRDFILENGKLNELSGFMKTKSNKVPLTFDSEYAFSNPNVEFINVLHPFIRSIVDTYDKKNNLNNAQNLALKSDLLREGTYLFFIYRLDLIAAKEKSTLEVLIIDENMDEACDREKAEILMGELLEKGTDSFSFLEYPVEVESTCMEKFCNKGDELFCARVKKIKEKAIIDNKVFLNRREASLKTSYEKNIRKKEVLLEKALHGEFDERYIRMLKGNIRNLKDELDAKLRDLNKHREVSPEYSQVAAGILEISPSEK